MWGIATEGLICAVLTGLMVLLFLYDLRSVIVVVLNIPLALLGSLVAQAGATRQPIEVHLVDPYAAGSGPVWRVDHDTDLAGLDIGEQSPVGGARFTAVRRKIIIDIGVIRNRQAHTTGQCLAVGVLARKGSWPLSR